MKVIKSKLPDNSILRKKGYNYDYEDSFQCDCDNQQRNISLTKIAKSFFTSGPKWISVLFALRNKIVGLFGLKTTGEITDKQQRIDNFKCEPGDRFGLFKVLDKTNNELVLGEDDKHLDFRISLFVAQKMDHIDQKTITVSTIVNFNNWFGRFYFFIVKPFHLLIVPKMLDAALKELKN